MPYTNVIRLLRIINEFTTLHTLAITISIRECTMNLMQRETNNIRVRQKSMSGGMRCGCRAARGVVEHRAAGCPSQLQTMVLGRTMNTMCTQARSDGSKRREKVDAVPV